MSISSVYRLSRQGSKLRPTNRAAASGLCKFQGKGKGKTLCMPLPMNRQIERPKSLKELQDEILADYVLAVKIHGLRAQFEAGFIYAISNPAWKGYLKVGSAINYSQRLQNYQTAAPLRDYEFAYVAVTGCRLLAERHALTSLSEYRVEQTEWFLVDKEVAINHLYNSAREYPYSGGKLRVSG